MAEAMGGGAKSGSCTEAARYGSDGALLRAAELSDEPQTSGGDGGRLTSDDAKLVQDALHFQHSIEVPVKCIGGLR